MSLDKIKYHVGEAFELIGDAANHLSKAMDVINSAEIELSVDNGRLADIIRELTNTREETKSYYHNL